MESFLYTLMFLLYGELPWKHKHAPALNFAEILEMKMTSTPEEMWPGLPSKQTIFYNF